MHDLVFLGLEGTSPLGMLASLGVLRLLVTRDPQVRMGWVRDQGWHPRFSSNDPWELDPLAKWLANTARDLGAVKASDIAERQRKAREAKARIKPLNEALKKAAVQAKADAKNMGLRGAEATVHVRAATADLMAKCRAAEEEHQATQTLLADALGQGVAHLGDIIGVQPEVFRTKAYWAQSNPMTEQAAIILDCLAAQGSDAWVDKNDRLLPTPYSFGNGAGGQCLLKDFRTLATSVTPEEMSALITYRSPLRREATSLNWDPLDQRSYALQWRNPETEPKQVDIAANVLGFLGLACLPAMPGARRLVAVGFGEGTSCWTWPLWDHPIPLDVVRSLLSDPELQAETPDRSSLVARGIAAHCRARRFSTNKRYFFSPVETR